MRYFEAQFLKHKTIRNNEIKKKHKKTHGINKENQLKSCRIDYFKGRKFRGYLILRFSRS